MKRTLFSVLIPTHNRAALLKETLASLERQTLKPEGLEIVISDDHSTDGTQAVIEDFRRRLPMIKPFRQETNLGVARNHEFLLKQAAGEFVHLLCDDDALAPEFLETHLGLFDKDPKLDMAFGDLELRSPDFKFLARLDLATPAGDLDGVARCRQQLLSHHMVQSIVYRRSALLSGGGWDSSVGCHLDCTAFCRSALRARNTHHVPRPMLYFRISSGSFSHALSTGNQGRLARWYRRKLDLLREDARTLWPEGSSFLSGMYPWHAKVVLGYLELELAHRHLSGKDARKAMAELLEIFPEGRRDIMRTKVWLASHLGTGWLRALRKILGRPDPYRSDLALFNSFPPLR